MKFHPNHPLIFDWITRSDKNILRVIGAGKVRDSVFTLELEIVSRTVALALVPTPLFTNSWILPTLNSVLWLFLVIIGKTWELSDKCEETFSVENYNYQEKCILGSHGITRSQDIPQFINFFELQLRILTIIVIVLTTSGFWSTFEKNFFWRCGFCRTKCVLLKSHKITQSQDTHYSQIYELSNFIWLISLFSWLYWTLVVFGANVRIHFLWRIKCPRKSVSS